MDEVKDMVNEWLDLREEREFRENENRAERQEQIRRDMAQRDGGFASYDPYD